jgi:hypothetical protein
MAGADKRAKLLSDLMAAKGAAASGDSRAAEGERERTSVIQIANRRLLEDRAAEPAAAPSVLYSKGAATAATFRPSYWSFDHDQQAEPAAAPADAALAPAVPAAPSHARNSRPLPVNFVVGFGCLALVVSTTLFVLSFWHRGESPPVQPEPTQIAAAPALAASVLAAPLPPEPPAVSAPAPSAPAAPAAIPPTPLAASEPPPAPTIATPAVEAPAEPAPAVAAVPAPSLNPNPNPNPEADALLARGDDLLATGDVAAARLFYQRAAEQGNAAAATAVGQTYDPAVLELLRVRGARGDARLAAEWYRKAIAAGDRQAEIRLKRLLARPAG